MRLLAHSFRIAAALAALYAFVLAGGNLAESTGAPVPGVVMGLALLALAVAMLRRHRPEVELRAVEFLAPASRPLLKHLGLLFVPAGAGVITQWPLIRAEWLPVLAGLFGSTWVGLAATAWLAQRLWPRDRE